MKIAVRVHPKSKQEKVEKISDLSFRVCFNVPPEKGKANKKLEKLLAEYFQVSISQVHIVFGSRSNMKIVEIC